MAAPVAGRSIAICRSPEGLARLGAELFIRDAVAAARGGREFTVALSGGSTPRRLFATLASAGYLERLPWAATHIFWADERCVPPDHPDSNYRLAHELLLSAAPVPATHVHRIPGELPPRRAALAYERDLAAHFAPSTLPRFDLVLLGMGEDGHTASIFPGAEPDEGETRPVASVYQHRLASHRVTLTLAAINNARRVLFLVSGSGKAGIVREILELGAEGYPAARVRPVDGTATWLLDLEAAGRLSPEFLAGECDIK